MNLPKGKEITKCTMLFSFALFFLMLILFCIFYKRIPTSEEVDVFLKIAFSCILFFSPISINIILDKIFGNRGERE